MDGGIERIGTCAGGREQGGRGRTPTVPMPVVVPAATSPALEAQAAATFEPIADLLDDVARLADGRDDPAAAASPGAVAVSIRERIAVALGAQARLGEAAVRALLGAFPHGDAATDRKRLP